MYLNLLLPLSMISCKMLLVETENNENQKGESHKKKIRGHHYKTARDYSADQSGSDWENTCSLKTPCSEESCMIQKDITGCGGSIHLLCTGGCINILKVKLLSSF